MRLWKAVGKNDWVTPNTPAEVPPFPSVHTGKCRACQSGRGLCTMGWLCKDHLKMVMYMGLRK